MVLESTIVCVDNSEYSRNGDFPPSRFDCQVDSINLLCSAKVNANAESSVGLLTLAGRSARILVTSTRDMGRIFTCMHDVKQDGLADVVAGIQKAQLALKHRQNTLQRQRIVVYVSSPITADTDTLVRLGKTLKKNSVAVDIINIGLEGDNVEKIDAFVAAVNSSDNSHALHVEAGGANLADAVLSSDIHTRQDAGAGVAAATPAAMDGADFGGVDAAGIDPELAMVLRISMEEERARQAAAREAEAAAAASSSGTATADASGSAAPASAEGAGAAAGSSKYDDDDGDLYGTAERMDIDDEDEELRRAIELSKAESEQIAAQSSSSGADGGDDDDNKDKEDKKES